MNKRISTPTTSDVPQHSLLKSLGLHVLPGALTTAAFLAFKPLLDTSGYPPLLAFLLAVTLVDLPVLLGVMLVAGKKRNGRYSLEGVVLYRDKVSWPWVEELYFRGYLLPRLSRYGKWTPLLGGLFFGLYHVWQLFSFPTLFLLGTALAVVVWWKRDIRISIGLHVFANALMRLMFLMVALAM